jgi:hypothetical protein
MLSKRGGVTEGLTVGLMQRPLTLVASSPLSAKERTSLGWLGLAHDTCSKRRQAVYTHLSHQHAPVLSLADFTLPKDR